MKSPTIKTLHGFEYYSECWFGYWTWHFRPNGGPFFIIGEGPKAKFISFLMDGDRALTYYQRRLASAVDVDRAKLALMRAKAFHAAVNSPDWDPGGSANNPGKVARAIREASRSESGITMAQGYLEYAIEWKAKLAEAPFDAEAWRATWLPRAKPLRISPRSRIRFS